MVTSHSVRTITKKFFTTFKIIIVSYPSMTFRLCIDAYNTTKNTTAVTFPMLLTMHAQLMLMYASHFYLYFSINSLLYTFPPYLIPSSLSISLLFSLFLLPFVIFFLSLAAFFLFFYLLLSTQSNQTFQVS